MHFFKRLGERVIARTFERQVAELQVRVALLNRFTQLRAPQKVAVAQSSLGSGKLCLVGILCSKVVTKNFSCNALKNFNYLDKEMNHAIN